MAASAIFILRELFRSDLEEPIASVVGMGAGLGVAFFGACAVLGVSMLPRGAAYLCIDNDGFTMKRGLAGTRRTGFSEVVGRFETQVHRTGIQTQTYVVYQIRDDRRLTTLMNRCLGVNGRTLDVFYDVGAPQHLADQLNERLEAYRGKLRGGSP